MNIHEHQAKQLLKEFGVPVPNGIYGFSVSEIIKKSKILNTEKYVLKAQIHAGGRGKAGGITIASNIDELEQAANQLLGKILITHQTGPKGKKVERLYVEEASNIAKEFYLSCLVDRKSSKIAFISSVQGGMDIEETALKNPEKIITTKVDFKEEISETDCEKIIKVFNLEYDAKDQGIELIKSLYKMFREKDASLIEINPLILTKENNIVCLDAKVILDDNAIFKHPEHLELRDLQEEDPTEIEASKHGLSYIKLDGNIGCMVNGAGLAMGTMDIIKLAGGEPANFLDVGGGASAQTVENGFKILLSDPNVKAILINIFGGIVRCDRVAEGVIQARKNIDVNVPIVVRLAGTNADVAAQMLEESDMDFAVGNGLKDAAEKAVVAIQ